MCAIGKRPICQDTGIVNVFISVGMDVSWEADMSLEDMINEGVRRGYTHPENVLRGSVLEDPDGARANTKDNTPAVIHPRIVPGDKIEIEVAAKGGGSEAKAKFAMLNPSDSVADWVLRWFLPWGRVGVLRDWGVGIGGTPEKAMLLAKQSLMDPIDMHELLERGPGNHLEELRIELYEKVNGLGIGAQGLGGLTTCFGCKGPGLSNSRCKQTGRCNPNCSDSSCSLLARWFWPCRV